MWDPYAEFQSTKLSNGLTVHAAHWPGRPWEAMGFLVHSGAEHDPIGLEGLSHFVEHLVSENASVPKKDICALFEDCGGIVNLGATGYPYTYYRFFVPTDKAILARAFSIFGQMLLAAKLEKFIERERQVIIEEFRHHYPANLTFDRDTRERKVLYAGCWLERFVLPLGNPEAVAQITQNELQQHYDTHYAPANISVVGVGGMQLAELVELLSESPFAANKSGTRTPLPIPVTDVSPLFETRYVFELSKYIVTPIAIGAYRSVSKIPGKINRRTLRIMREMLNEALNEEVRERRAWAYAINSSWRNFRHLHEFSINCNAFAARAIDEIEAVIEICVASIFDREDLFEQIRRRALANNLMIDTTGINVCNGALGDLVEDQRIISLKEIGDDLARVRMSDIRDALQWLRPERRWTLITRP